MTRHQCRIVVVQSLFAWEFAPHNLDEILRLEWLDASFAKNRTRGDLFFIQAYVRGATENIAEIDEKIKQNLDGWDFDRISKIDVAILRQAIYSLLYQKDCDAPIVFDEAITLAKEYSADDSYKFINAVLQKVCPRKQKAVVKRKSSKN